MPDKYGMLSVSLFEGLGHDIYEAVTHHQSERHEDSFKVCFSHQLTLSLAIMMCLF